MKYVLALIACVVLALPAQAQIGSGPTLPATGNCNVVGGAIFYLTAGDAGLYVCEDNAWVKKLAPGGGGESAWGEITGTLSDQTDLQTALDSKGTSNFSGDYDDLTNTPTLGTAAATASTDYATAAQGAKADSALQPAGNGSQLTGLTKAQVGLGNVDNTSDASKPISTATQTALNAKQATLVSGTNLKTVNGNSLLGSGDLTVSGEGGLPAGAILLILSGTCPTGYSEATELAGKTLIGTLAANGDVGTGGGSDTITQVINHTHPVNDPGHTHVEQQNSATTGGLTGWSARDTSTNTAAATGYSTQSATTGVTTTNPVGGVASVDNRSAFLFVIFCKKD